MLEMQVTGLGVDPLTRSPILVLKDASGEQSLSIWIGLNEANAILLQMEGIPTPRPMTHDLLKNILEKTEIPVKRVVLTDILDDTWYAVIEILHRGNVLEIDSRTSDAIALAMRAGVPIMVEPRVLEKAKLRKPPEPDQTEPM